METSFLVTSPTELPAAAQWLNKIITDSHRNVVALYGEMGVGKTTFVSAFASMMGAVQKASSPTFAIVNAYDIPAGNHIYHFDFYRIDDIREALDLGFFDYTDSNALCFIEWPERIEPLLKELDVINIHIELLENGNRRFLILNVEC